jgi:hypothetical protein
VGSDAQRADRLAAIAASTRRQASNHSADSALHAFRQLVASDATVRVDIERVFRKAISAAFSDAVNVSGPTGIM